MKELKGLKILVVEDEDDLRDVVIDILNASGAAVLGAPNGNVAYELLQQNKVDVVITDLRMPGGDGLSLIRRIHDQMSLKPKIFVCSAFSDHSQEELKKLGVIECFPKPFDFDSMIQSIIKAF